MAIVPRRASALVRRPTAGFAVSPMQTPGQPRIHVRLDFYLTRHECAIPFPDLWILYGCPCRWTLTLGRRFCTFGNCQPHGLRFSPWSMFLPPRSSCFFLRFISAGVLHPSVGFLIDLSARVFLFPSISFSLLPLFNLSASMSFSFPPLIYQRLCSSPFLWFPSILWPVGICCFYYVRSCCVAASRAL